MSFADNMLKAIKNAGVKIASSVPDEWLSPVIEALNGSDELKHAPAAREEDAIGICCGASLAGVRAICIIQSAGALNSGGVLATLANSYGIPLVMIVADRGRLSDATVFHFEKARAFRPFLNSLGISYYELSTNFMETGQLEDAFRLAETGQRPVALLITPKTFEGFK